MKAVNVWYQNKRRSMKKKSLAWNRAVSENDTLRSRSAPQTTQSKSAHRSLLRSCSLDTIVESRQLRDSRSSSSRPPLSRRAHTPNRQYDLAPASAPSGNHDIEIWEHIPSSPTLPPSSPSEDCLRFAVLPPRSKVLRSLEFACAKERSAWRRRLPDEEEEDRDVPQMDLDAISGLDGDDTEPEVDEVLTPDVSMDTFPDFSQRPTLPNDGSPRQLRRPGMEVMGEGAVFPAEDVEAAMALLGFSVHKL
ncbi:hypothetical protein PHLCEN_2v8252 [Hermanssonia centrifuga]|uniref:Homeobox domain-containing protein n=1 Tax=Hermanssonia centrifuga TaxID=98765 RepID=A0A2R6NU18_9APHY|nr:hypothetical protein PHLCEN_2v8252 [Hermanssonia centrifuga]